MKAVRLIQILAALITALPLSTRAQTLVDPARAAQGIRPDISAQPVLRDREALATEGLAAENTFAPPTPGDQDLGQQVLLKRREHNQPFSAGLDSSEFFTDNAANVHTNRVSDWFFMGGVTLGYQPQVTGRLYLDAVVSEHWYRYDRHSELDYEDGQAAAGLILLTPELWNTLWSLQYYYERITDGLGDTPTYQTHNLRVGVQKTALIDRLNSINLSLLASFALDASPISLQRHEYSAFAGWNYKIMRNLVFTLSYHLIYYDYFNLDSRHDWYHNFGAVLVWRPREWLELAASYNYALNRSNQEDFSYNAQLTGPSLSLRMKF